MLKNNEFNFVKKIIMKYRCFVDIWTTGLSNVVSQTSPKHAQVDPVSMYGQVGHFVDK